MKGREIINHITQGKMPNIEEVRQRCLSQSDTSRHTRRIRIKTAVAIAAAFIIFATAAYAVVERGYQRVETGGFWDIVILPDDEYGRQVYQERNEGRMYGRPVYWSISDNMYIRRINADMAQFINEQLAGQIFMADGTVIDFELAVPMSGFLNFGNHHIDDRGHVLYTADGHQIGSIFIQSSGGGELIGIDIRTKEQELMNLEYNATYEEVVIALGRTPRLPTAHMEIFQPPGFNMFNIFRYSDCGREEWNVRIRYHVQELSGIMDWCPDSMSIFVENARYESGSSQATMYYLGGEAIAHDIAGITVYELNLPDTVQHFIWIHDGLVYRLTPSRRFTLGQTIDVIRSMIE